MIWPKGYVCGRATNPPEIDGRLDDPDWLLAPWTDDFTDIEGFKKPPPRYRTRAKLMWDDRYLYIGAVLEEPHVWATLTKHDSVIFQDNDFEIFIDPDGDNHQYYEIEINALNAEWDLRLVKPYRDGGPALNEWEIPGIRHAVHVDGTINDAGDIDRGWSVEMAIPWQALGEFANCSCPPNPGDQWRINFSRVEWLVDVVDGVYKKIYGVPEANWVWSPQGIIDMHQPETWGYAQFANEPPGKGVFVPDETYPARMLLMNVYRAQRSYKKLNGVWAAKIGDLGIQSVDGAPSLHEVVLDHSAAGWTASVSDGVAGAVEVDQDSRLRVIR